MTGNVAFGTAAPSAAIPERPPAASEVPLDGEPGPASAATADPAFEAARRAREVCFVQSALLEHHGSLLHYTFLHPSVKKNVFMWRDF